MLTHPETYNMGNQQAHTLSQAYNSIFNDDPNTPRLIGNFPLLPLRTKTRGPAYTLPLVALPAHESPDPDSESYDILDEILALFRANTFFRNFEIQGPADRLLVYGIWFLSDCLGKIKPTATVKEATKDVLNLALDLNFAIPGDPGWPLNQVGDLMNWGECGGGADRIRGFVNKVADNNHRCMKPLGTDKTPNSSSNTWHRCGKSWLHAYWRGYMRRMRRSPASGG